MGDRIAIMNAGQLQQVAKPLELYNKPANLFVAEFIGSPPMNFLPLQVDRDGNLHGESLVKSFSIQELPLKEIGTDHVFILGFRPEDLRPAAADQAHIEGTVELVEALGSETIVLLKLADTEVRARVSADVGLQHNWQIGDRSFWRFDLNKLYAFDSQSGLTLHHPYLE